MLLARRGRAPRRLARAPWRQARAAGGGAHPGVARRGRRAAFPSQPSMDLTELRKLVQLMLRADLAELELDDTKRGLRVHLKRDTGRRASEPGLAGVMQVLPAAVPVAAQALTQPAAAAPVAPAGPPPGTEVFKSPIVGTLYRSPSPDAEPFVSVGSTFAEGA